MGTSYERGLMTTPNYGAPSVANNSTTPATKPPMTDTEIRLECLKQAVIHDPPRGTLVATAQKMYDFVSAKT